MPACVCACAQMVDIVPYTDNVEPIRAFLLPCVRCVGGKIDADLHPSAVRGSGCVSAGGCRWNPHSL